MKRSLLIALSLMPLVACGQSAPAATADAASLADTLVPTIMPMPADSNSVLEAEKALSRFDDSEQGFKQRIAAGDTLPIPSGVYIQKFVACTRWPNADGGRDSATGEFVRQDGLACLAEDGSLVNQAVAEVDLSTCADIERWYAEQGWDWNAHSDGKYFATVCSGRPPSYRVHAAETLDKRGILHRFDGKKWHLASSLADLR